MRFTIDEIRRVVDGSYDVEPDDPSRIATGLSWDSRTVQASMVYAALVGERTDGHRYMKGAVDAGAVAVLVDGEVSADALAAAREQGAAVIRTADVRAAIDALAAAWRDRLEARIVAVTGSVGKTTTKNLIADVLAKRFVTQATRGNYNNELGVPATLLAATQDCQMLVVEMGMDGAGQIAHLCELAHPDMGVVTNVGTAHIEYLGSRENIARAKGELIEALPDGRGVAFLQADGEYTDFICEHARTSERGVKVVRYGGSSDAADVWATGAYLDAEGHPHFTLHAGAGHIACSMALRGLHNVENACAAAAVGLYVGLDLDEIAEALADAQPEAGRMQLVQAPGGVTLFDDTYNANPDSMIASLATLAAYEVDGRRIAVLGDMGDMGDTAHDAHARVGRAAAADGIDELVCVGPLSVAMAEAARDAGMDAAHVVCVDDAAGALAYARGILHAGDCVLVKASHYMGLGAVVKGVVG